MAGINQDHLEAALLEDLVERNPIDPGRLQRDRLDTALGQPVGHALEVGGKGAKRLHRLGIPISGHCHVVMLRTAVDPGGIRLDPFEQWGPDPAWVFAGSPAVGLVLHGRLFDTELADGAGDRGLRELSTLLDGITTGVSPLSFSHYPMDHAVRRARNGTNGESVAVPRRRRILGIPDLFLACRGAAWPRDPLPGGDALIQASLRRCENSSHRTPLPSHAHPEAGEGILSSS